MAGKSNKQPVTFEQLDVVLEELRATITLCKSGEYTTKHKSKKLLSDFRRKLSSLSKMVVGARIHSFNQSLSISNTSY